MNIHEYQAKAVLSRYGVNVPKGKVADTPAQAEVIAEEFGTPVVIKAQIHAGGRGKGGGVKLAKNSTEARKYAHEIIGMTLVTPQTGPQGRKVKRVLVEQAGKIQQGALPRHHHRPGGLEGRRDGLDGRRDGHRDRRGQHPGKDPEGVGGPGGRPGSVPGAETGLRAGDPQGAYRESGEIDDGDLQCLRGHGLLPGRDQPARPDRGRRHRRAGREDELREQRPVPPPGHPGAAGLRRGGPDGNGGVEPRPLLHPPRRQHRLHGERRGAGDGHDGHDQDVAAATRRTSSTWGAARASNR